MASRGFAPLFAVALVAILAVSALPAAGSGLDLDSAKSQGLIGEKADGYVGIVGAESTAPVAALVKNVNAKRAAAYAEIAKKNGTSVDAVAALAGEKLIEKAGRGAWVTDKDG
ncbi:MAG: YdbL family protein, partial [Myxococcota bacterium]